MHTTYNVERPEQLLAFLVACFPRVKKTKVRQWLTHGSVQVNGQAITQGNHQLRIGDTVSLLGRTKPAPLPRGLQIRFEDSSLIVIDKPANLLSVATEAQREKTAYAWLTNYVRRGNPRSRERVWIVHRLDRETSGLMVFARTEPVQRALRDQWSETEKRYLALVEGHPPADRGVLKSHLDESDAYKVRSGSPSEQTRLAITRYRVLRQSAHGALLELTLETGRRNQIRVHLADAACPIIGDHKYGACTNPAGRLGLHASSLTFRHPVSGEILTFESPLPRILARLT